MTNILVIGDTHMDTSSICNVAISKARKNDIHTIVQLGDFGFWEHQDRGRRFLDKISKCLVREQINMYWIDGNHDNHPLLWETYGNDDICQVRPNLFYVPRGTVWSMHGVTCMGLGGAFSIDKEWRIQEELMNAGLMRGRFDVHHTDVDMGSDFEHTLWWPTEMVTDDDVERAVRHAHGKNVDIMFTHDCPTGVDIPGIHSEGKWVFHETWLNRDKLEVVFDRVQPKLLMHGHYHIRYTGKKALKPRQPTTDGGLLDWDYCRVDGLACNGMHGFAVALDLDSLFMAESEPEPITEKHAKAVQEVIDAANVLKYHV